MLRVQPTSAPTPTPRPAPKLTLTLFNNLHPTPLISTYPSPLYPKP